jgi:hypothetical protein
MQYNTKVEQRGMDVTAACHFYKKNNLVDSRVFVLLSYEYFGLNPLSHLHPLDNSAIGLMIYSPASSALMNDSSSQ